MPAGKDTLFSSGYSAKLSLQFQLTDPITPKDYSKKKGNEKLSIQNGKNQLLTQNLIVRFHLLMKVSVSVPVFD
jgi:hypothetical protein